MCLAWGRRGRSPRPRRQMSHHRLRELSLTLIKYETQTYRPQGTVAAAKGERGMERGRGRGRGRGGDGEHETEESKKK